MSEQVLVIPTAVLHDAGLFHGFSADVEHYLPKLLDVRHFRYLPRDEAELDPSYKQLIPYLVLRYGGRVFHYRRAGGGEKRLAAKRSIGIGGHISRDDGDLAGAYRQGMLRELSEEVALSGGYTERCIGLINDDRTPVGQVHLGVVHVLELDRAEVTSRELALAESGFAAVAELREELESFETWSQFLLQGGL